MNRRIVDHAHAQRAALTMAIWVPLAIVVACVVVVFADGLANGGLVHWGPTPTDTTHWWVPATLISAIGLPVIAGIGFFLTRATRMTGMNSWMPAICLGLTVFHCLGLGVGPVLFGASLATAIPILVGFALGVVVALVIWAFLPQEAPAPAAVERADAVPVKPGDVMAWTGRISPPAALIALLIGVILITLTAGTILILTLHVRGAMLWILSIVFFIVLITTAEFRVAAGPAGLTVRSVVGWPSFRIPTTEITRAGVVDVDPLADFGGWGLHWVIGRSGKGRLGIVSRRGAALEVVRQDGRSFVLTIDDASTAAAVLETYAKEKA